MPGQPEKISSFLTQLGWNLPKKVVYRPKANFEGYFIHLWGISISEFHSFTEAPTITS